MIFHSDFLADDNGNQVIEEMVDDYNVLSIDGKKYFAVKGALPKMNWDYICLVSYDKTFRSIFLSYLLYLVIIFSSVILSIFLSSILIRLLIKHFDNLIYKMRSFRGHVTERIDVGYDYTNRQDEFGILHRQFDSMATEIQDLIQVNYVNELLVRDAKFKAL
jgi:two-component system sensor histidine kinase YesM